MGLKNIVLLLVVVLIAFGEAKHMHPRTEQWTDSTEERVVNLNNKEGTAETEAVNIVKPKKMSLLSSILFFKSYDPCEEGFEMDYQGICREVWY